MVAMAQFLNYLKTLFTLSTNFTLLSVNQVNVFPHTSLKSTQKNHKYLNFCDLVTKRDDVTAKHISTSKSIKRTR